MSEGLLWISSRVHTRCEGAGSWITKKLFHLYIYIFTSCECMIYLHVFVSITSVSGASETKREC